VQVDVEGADGVCLEQLAALGPGGRPRFLSFELNCLPWLEAAVGLGYNAFKLVPQVMPPSYPSPSCAQPPSHPSPAQPTALMAGDAFARRPRTARLRTTAPRVTARSTAPAASVTPSEGSAAYVPNKFGVPGV
jgi:hypothetical protein